MALARVVAFEGVDRERMDQLAGQVESDPRPDDVPATEIVMLHDSVGNRSLVILFFDSEEDYERGNAALNAMDPGDTPGTRASVDRYEVALRRQS